jgi:hypothetical protein
MKNKITEQVMKSQSKLFAPFLFSPHSRIVIGMFSSRGSATRVVVIVVVMNCAETILNQGSAARSYDSAGRRSGSKLCMHLMSIMCLLVPEW